MIIDLKNYKESWYAAKLSDMDVVIILDTDDCIIDYDKDQKMYRVSIFEDNHFKDEYWFDAYVDDEISYLENYVEKNYSPVKCGWTSSRSAGNYDDCFEDGYECGISWSAHTIGEILGMELDDPEGTDDF